MLFMGKEETHVVYIKPRIYSSYNWNLKSVIIVTPDLIIKEKKRIILPLRLLYTRTCSSLVPAVLPMVLRLGGCGLAADLGVWWWECYCSLLASGVLRWEQYDVRVDGFFFFTPEST